MKQPSSVCRAWSGKVANLRMIPYLHALQYFAHTKDIYTRSREELLADQWQRVQTIINYAYAHVPFYRGLWSRHSVTPADVQHPTDMGKIPIVTKAELRSAYPESALSDQFESGEYQELSTSGSTGEPFKFAKDKAAIGKTIAVNYRTCTLSGYRLGRKVLQVAPPISGGSKWAVRLTDAILQREVVDTFSGDYENTLKLLGSFNPTFIVGYASYIHILAKIALTRSWRPSHRIVAIMTTSETLLPQMRATISQAFRADVFDQYGSNEFGRVAGECKHHRGYHINTDAAYIEVLDLHSDKRLDIGQSGRLIVTGLTNHAMPLIRYEIGDTGAISDRYCPCQNETPLLTDIGGRLQDVLWHTNGTPLPPDYLYRVLREHDEIQNYQVIQESGDFVRVRVVSRDELSDETTRSIQGLINGYLGCDVVVEKVARIPRIAGKFKHIVSTIHR